MKLTPKHTEELHQLAMKFLAIQTEPPPAPICKSCGRVWEFSFPAIVCCENPEVYHTADTRFARQVGLLGPAMAIIVEAKKLDEAEEDEKFVCKIAASMIPWEQVGDEHAARLAVRAVRQILLASKLDTKPLDIPS